MTTTRGTAVPDALDDLRDSARGFFERHNSLTALRETTTTPSGFAQSVWVRAAQELGFSAMIVPESLDGIGATVTELAVVAEQAGRTLYSGPLLSTVYLSTPLLLELRACPARDEYLRSIAGSGTVMTAGVDNDGQHAVLAELVGGEWVLDGVAHMVPDAGAAETVLVVARVGESPALFAVSSGAARSTPVESIDITKRLYDVEFQRCAATPLSVDDKEFSRQLERALDTTRTLIAVEQVGGAARTLELLIEYTTQRIQFERPIASFQSVKHDCADMLVDVTSARAAVTEAIRRIVTRDERAGHYAALAKAVASEAFLTVTERSIQLHGGIGFTWECDAHLYYRRAIFDYALLGDPAEMRERLARDLDVPGTASTAVKDTAWTAAGSEPELRPRTDYDAVYAEVVDWLQQNWDPALTTRVWWRRLAEAGWSMPHWPAEWSGRDLPGPLLPAVHDAFADAGALWPPWSPGQHLAGPTVIHHGDQDQKERLLPALVTGEHFWCQLFSEPNAGSDLASLRTRAVKQSDGGWLVNGQKVWTTGATKAERGFLLARTDPSAPKHRGLSYFVIDMDTPGLDVRTIKQINGNEEFCEVFLTDVYIPPTGLIGEENGGWAVSLTSLGFERMAAPPVRVPAGDFGTFLDMPAGEALKLATGPRRDLMDFQDAYKLFRDAYRERNAGRDPVLEDELVKLYVDTELDQLVGGMVSPGPGMTTASTGSISKLVSQRLATHLRSLAWRVSGPASILAGTDAPAAGAVGFMALTSFTENIAGGTEQIQKNIVAERVLGMPREPRP